MADIRIFVALELPGIVGQLVVEVAKHLSHLNQVRWVKPKGAHLTLKFLGDVAENVLPEVVVVVKHVAAKCDPLRLATTQVGGFPGLDRAQVIWLGVDGDLDRLYGLQSQIEMGLEGLGFKPERRKFKAHITVGRARRKPVKVDVERVSALRPIHFSIDRVSVMKSDLNPEGAVYTPMGYGIFGAG